MKLLDLKNKIAKLPKTPGVYIFFGKSKHRKKKILYIGKATSLQDRVKSYFVFSNFFLEEKKREKRPIEMMIDEVTDIKVYKTDTVLEALILESQLIKKFQPKYNALGKDDKSFSYIGLTKEDFPRYLILREKDVNLEQKIKFKMQSNKISFLKFFGPYVSKKQAETALKILRKIFPFHSNSQKTEKGCLDFELGRCPGPYAGAITKKDYMKNIRAISMILAGKKKSLVKKLEKEMRTYANHYEFEKAADLRDKLFSLKHILDVALITNDQNFQFYYFDKSRTKQAVSSFQAKSELQFSIFKPLRIEAYDISNIAGQYATGSMVVFKNNKPDKSQYRKFKIKTIKGINDVKMMKEVLKRRFQNDWPKPNLILLDGGVGHFNMGKKVIDNLGLNIPIMAVAKGRVRKNFRLISDKTLKSKISKGIIQILDNQKLIKQIMDEAHRLAVNYHRNLREKNLFN